MLDAPRVIEVRPLTEDEVGLVCARLPVSRLGKPGGVYLVAWQGEEPVGHAHLDRRADPPELQDVYVVEPFRRRGVATALTAAAERAAAADGNAELSLSVSERNAAAIALYERLGYRRTDAPPERVHGTVQLRTGPLHVDDVLLRYAKPL
jgi:[ribosomal protein S18]-alanine N-acetyltransferase